MGLSLAALTLLVSARAYAQDIPPTPELDKLLDKDGKVWAVGADEFADTQSSTGFRWLSATAKDTARSTDPRLTFGGLPVLEALARFDGGTLKGLSLSLYNRGDAGTMREEEFLPLLASIDKSLTTWARSGGIAFKGEERTTSVTVMRKAWVKGPHRVDMIWSFTAKSRERGVDANRPEYVRLEITRFDPLDDPRHLIATSLQSRMKAPTLFDLRARVSHTANGDVLVPDVPMVDQGPKGYCAAAVAERLLRYFGKEIDQHEIAQLANTSANGGTTPQAMVAALRRVGDEFGLDVTVQQDFNVAEFEMLVKNYNRSAKSFHVMPIELAAANSLPQIYKEMDTDLLRELRLRRDGEMISFGQTVTRYIGNGLPLAWAVMYGKIRETPPVRGVGGHIRLIIGYNSRTAEILYSDSWGAGHELKRLSLTDAWTMTLGLYTIQPRDIRF